jgi:hypothetical protein
MYTMFTAHCQYGIVQSRLRGVALSRSVLDRGKRRIVVLKHKAPGTRLETARSLSVKSLADSL